MKTKIAIIGRGRVGTALKRALEHRQYTVETAGKNAEAVRQIGQWAELIILAVPYVEIDATLRELDRTVDGKALVDVSNPVRPDMSFAVDVAMSGAERLQGKAPTARVVKALNTVFAKHMLTGRLGDQALTAFVAGDRDAKARVLELAKEIGFDPVDAGPLRNAIWLEALGYFNITLGYRLDMGPDIGFKLLHVP